MTPPPLQNLARNIGAAVGISVTAFMLARNTQVSHADIAAGITPFNRMLQHQDAVTQYLNPGNTHGVEALDAIINRQAQIIAFGNDYRMMTFMGAPLLLLLVMRRPAKPVPEITGSQCPCDQSMTSLARATIEAGTSRPMACAVLRLRVSTTWSFSSNGSSATRAPCSRRCT